MTKKPSNSGKEWTKSDDALLVRLAAQNTPTRVAALKLKRTPGAVQQHASHIGLSLKPVNQRPSKRGKGRVTGR